MKNVNIIIQSKDRALQVKALLESFFLNMTRYHPVKFTVLYDDSNREVFFHADTYRTLQNEYSYANFIRVSYKEGFDIASYFNEGEYNLVLPDNAIFSCPFDLHALYEIDDGDILDLFKGLNRQMNINGTFRHEVGVWKRDTELYYLDSHVDCFESLDASNKYYGKIFLSRFNESPNKTHFYPISPVFINGVNTVEEIDAYSLDDIIEYNPYALCTRYMIGEKINVRELQFYSPNTIVDQYFFKFELPFEMPTIESAFPNRLYINLPHRLDRQQQFEHELKTTLNISAQRIDGIVPIFEEITKINQNKNLSEHDLHFSKNRIGCTKSHLSAVQMAKDNNWDYVLIMEDDCKFLSSARYNIECALSELEYLPRWDILYFGANSLAPIRQISPHIGILSGAYCTHAYVVPKHFYDVILQYDWNEYLVIDQWYFNICRDSRYMAYTVLPIVATQKSSFSDIEGKIVNYERIIIDSYQNTLNKI